MVRLLTLPAGLTLAAALLTALPAAAATADAGKGKVVFASQCAMCHSAAKNGPTILGPSLFGVVGRTAGSVKGFAYSPAVKAAGFVWSDDRLHSFLPAPAKALPGTRMPYGGLKNPAQLDDLIAYLDTLK